MKTLEQLTDEMNVNRELWLGRERLYLKAQEVADTLKGLTDLAEEIYEKSKRAVDMYEEDQIDLAESKKDLDEDMALEDLRQSE